MSLKMHLNCGRKLNYFTKTNLTTLLTRLNFCVRDLILYEHLYLNARIFSETCVQLTLANESLSCLLQEEVKLELL